MSKPAISNFHYVELYSRSFQCFLGLFSVHYLQGFHVKSLGEKYQTLKDLDEPVVKPNSYEVRYEWKLCKTYVFTKKKVMT